MKQDIKICLPSYKIVYSFLFVFLLPIIRLIGNVTEIGFILDTNIALLAIVTCADLYYMENKGAREIFLLTPVVKKNMVLKRRFAIEFSYLILLSAIGYLLFYLRNPYILEGINELSLFLKVMVKTGISVLFFGIASIMFVNIFKNIWAGIGTSIIIWLLLNSKFGAALPVIFRVFDFASENLQSDIGNISWVWGKLTALSCVIIMIIIGNKIVMKGKW